MTMPRSRCITLFKRVSEQAKTNLDAYNSSHEKIIQDSIQLKANFEAKRAEVHDLHSKLDTYLKNPSKENFEELQKVTAPSHSR